MFRQGKLAQLSSVELGPTTACPPRLSLWTRRAPELIEASTGPTNLGTSDRLKNDLRPF